MKVKIKEINGAVVLFLAFVLCSCASDLHYNAKTGDIAGIDKRLASGDPIEKRDNSGNTPLIVAVSSNNPKTVEYLCRRGANVNAQNNGGSTALITAAYYNLLDVTTVLLKYNPDKTLKDKFGNTALDYAVQYNYAEMISLLKK